MFKVVGKDAKEYVCLSTDTKPTDVKNGWGGIANGSLCLEMDTGKIYAFDEQNKMWLEIA